MASLQKEQGKKIKLQTAMVISENHNSHIVAIIGDKQANNPSFNRAINIKRNIGSLVKPAIYLTAFQQGYRPDSLIDDSPIKVKISADNYWYPNNFDHKSHGKVALSTALSKSFNIASVRLGLTIGLDKVLETLRLLGVAQDLPVYPSVLLGALALSPYDINQMYQTLANKGVYQNLTGIVGVLDKYNKVLPIVKQKRSLRFSRQEIKQLDDVLKLVIQQGTAAAIKKYLPEAIPLSSKSLSAKTGTSNKNRDSWFVAYNDQYTATVWLGNDKNKPIKYTGSSGAMIIWAKVMKEFF